MNKISILVFGISIGLCGFLNSCNLLPASKQNSPNIVYLMTDDQRWNHIGPYNKEFHTPVLDDIANEGVVFDNAFYCVSICHPSRATVLLGQYPGRHKYGREEPWRKTISNAEFSKSYPAILRDAGYHVGFIGKIDVPVSEQKENSYNDQGKTKSSLEEYAPDDWFDYWAGWTDKFEAKNGTAFFPEVNWGHEKIEIPKDGKGNHVTRLVGEHMVQFLKKRPANKPFCLSVSFKASKGINSVENIDREHLELFKDKIFTVPESYVQDVDKSVPEVIRKNFRGANSHRAHTNTYEKFQNRTMHSAALAYSIDSAIGRLVQELKRQGVYDNTILIFTSDNGKTFGDHALHCKVLAYESSIRAPLIVRDPRIPENMKGSRIENLVSTVDYAPSILSLAGLPVPASMQGLDFRPLLMGKQPKSWRNELLIVNNRSFIKEGQKLSEKSIRYRAIRTNRWKYVCYYELSTMVEQLFDLQDDPNEFTNLSTNKAYNDQLKTMRKLCEKKFLDSE